jgi:pimeloyl-ACP methyl ester carboxylesterase
MQLHSGFAAVNGTRLYYEVAGSGPPLVLIHGFSLDNRMWQEQVPAFTESYKVIRYDVRGFGKSQVPTDESYTSPNDLRALLDHLGIGHAFVLGLSMGGEIAINFALAYPDTVDALVLVDASLGGYQSKEFGPSIAQILAKIREFGIQGAKEAWMNHDLFVPAMAVPSVAARLRQMISQYSGWHFVNRDPEQKPDPPAIQQLNTISKPTLVIVGQRDLVDFQAIADILARTIPDAQKVVLPGVGHMSNMEDPTAFNKVVLSFLADR